MTQVSITPIPVDRAPFPLPTHFTVPVYFTVQPGGAYVHTAGNGLKGAQLVYPNYHHAPAGQRVQFYQTIGSMRSMSALTESPLSGGQAQRPPATAPDSVRQWRQALAESQAVLIASPEYGHSLPGALKNGIDWVIGSGELEQKIVAITAAVSAVDRGRRGLHALRDTLLAVRATIVGGEPILGGPQFEPQVAALVQALVDAARPGDRISAAPPWSTPTS